MDVWLEVAVIFVLTLLNGVFAMSEIAIISARKARLQQRADDGDAGAQVALELANEPDRFLSTVQVGITLLGILAGSYGGATLARKLAAGLVGVGWLAPPAAGAVALAAVVVGITFVSLLLGELAPSRIALLNAEGIASVVSRPMRAMSRFCTPIVAVLGASTAAVLRLLRLRPTNEPPVTPEEITIMLEQGQQAGVFEKAEQDIVSRTFRLSDRRISSLMTPRTDIVWVDVEDPIGDSMRTMATGRHTYFPLCRGNIDEVIGMVSVKEQWRRMATRQPPDLMADLQEPLYVPESMTALKVLEAFRASGRHIALVIDEYGSLLGLVTVSDILEELVGGMPDVEHPEDELAVQRADGSWLLDGALPVERIAEILELDEAPGAEGDVDTLAGFLMHELGRVPSVTDVVSWAGLRFEVVDMDGRRVDKVLATRVVEPSGDEQGGPTSAG